MELIDKDRLKFVFEKNVVSADIFNSLIDAQPTVDAIPIEWIENYIYDLNTGKQTHHLDADEYISNSDEVYYLRYLLKKWKQEKQNDTAN